MKLIRGVLYVLGKGNGEHTFNSFAVPSAFEL